jgi:hypothetical protein
MGLWGRHGRHVFIPLCRFCEAELRQVGCGVDNPDLCINCENKLNSQVEKGLKEQQKQQQQGNGGWW